MTTTKEIFNALVGDSTINSMRNYDGGMRYVPNNRDTHKHGILDFILIAPILNRFLFLMIRRVCSSLFNAFLNDNNGIGEAVVRLSVLTIFLFPLSLFIIHFITHWLPYVIEAINNIVKYTLATLISCFLILPVMCFENAIISIFGCEPPPPYEEPPPYAPFTPYTLGHLPTYNQAWCGDDGTVLEVAPPYALH